jgi:MtrB/PioB family decaheme-associated outer membrane protein
MRSICMVATLTLALLPRGAGAQPGPPPAETPQPHPTEQGGGGTAGWTGTVDFGLRGTVANGDTARYERYRDLGVGAFAERVRVSREKNGWLFDAAADHVGRRDQRYRLDADRPGKITVWFLYDQIPMLLSRTTRTLYTGLGTSALSIDDGLQARVQLNPAAIEPVFDQNSVDFETRTRRQIVEGGFKYLPTPELTVNGTIRHTNRQGDIAYGGSFGHSSLVELPAPTEHQLTDADAGAEFVRDPVLLRAGYVGSFFHNDVTSLVFDNPYRAIDSTSASSRGRLTLAPTNSYNGVSGMASVKLPRRSRASAYVSAGVLTDAGDPIVPQTINSTLQTAPLDRTTVDGRARTTGVNLTFVSRPARHLDFTAGYRQYDYDNRTPEFALTERVSYDNAVTPLAAPVFTEPFGVKRHTADADLKLVQMRGGTAGVGFTRLAEERSHRIFESTTDNTIRVLFDTVGQSWLALRTKYEHAERRGTGIEQGEQELAAIGEQPGMRHYDIASRNRDRVTIQGSVTASSSIGINGSIAVGKDDFLESEFGLRDNTHRVYALGLNATPTERLLLGGSYSYERYHALSRSRQANPGPQFTDPSRNWATDAIDGAHSLVVNADLARIAGKVDLRLLYDFSRASARYHYITGPVPDRTLPEEAVAPTTLPPPLALPPTMSELQRGVLDCSYSLGPRVSIGVSYWYEQYRVEDFTLDVDANPGLVRGTALLIGYLYQPYSANTVWGRLIYRF